MVETRSQKKIASDSEVPTTSTAPPVEGAPGLAEQSLSATRPPSRQRSVRSNTESPSRSIVTARSEHSHSARTQSSHSSATVRARKLAAEAELMRLRVDRERRLVEMEYEAEQMELQAKLATLEASNRSCRSGNSSLRQTASWVRNATLTNAATQHVLETVPAPPVKFAAPPANPVPVNRPPADPISQLANAISNLSTRPKRPDLMVFSGDVSQWMAFKSSFERTKGLFSPTENLERLNQAIRGAAYQSVASLLWTACEPEDVMHALEQSFARPELLVARELADLHSIAKIHTPHDLNNLSNKVRNFIVTLKQLNQPDHLYSPELFRSVALKLNEYTRARFTDFAASHSGNNESISKLELLSRFLLLEADQQLKFNYFYDHTSVSHRLSKKESVHVTLSNKTEVTCDYCKQGSHNIKLCKKFLDLSVEKRWDWVRESKTCFRCLKSNSHKWRNCRAKRCGVTGCLRRHHRLLHGTLTSLSTANINQHPTPTNTNDSNTNAVASSVANISVAAAGLSQSKSRIRGLLKVLPVIVEGPDGEFSTTALLDEGSTATLIDGDVATRIGAERHDKESVRIEGVGGMNMTVDVNYVNFYIRGRNSGNRFLIENARSITPLGLRVRSLPDIDVTSYEHLADIADELSFCHDTDQSTPTILIGAADWDLSLSREVRVGKKNEPVASKTLLGWVLHGAYSVSSKPVVFINHTNDDLDDLIRSQFEIDSIGISKRDQQLNEQDRRAVDIIESSVRRLQDGRFEVGLPWRKTLPKVIPDSYPQALSRFKALERQMARDPNFASAFQLFINDIISKGYAEKCDPTTYHNRLTANVSAVDSNGTIRWYLPIFGVYHPQKRKLRVVHDAAATTQGVSLNSLLCQGPDLLQPLLGVLFRFREGAVALNADIREMFPQVRIAPKDRDAQRFLWRDKDGSICEYRMAAMIFGAVCSPFMAQYLKNKNAKELGAIYPAASKAILYDHYMDDYLGSFPTVTEAARIAAEIVHVHQNCCFEMRSWTSNKPEALSLIRKDFRRDIKADVSLPPNTEVGVLGVRWDSSNDYLSFRPLASCQSDPFTKRIVLSQIMKVYDPLGLLMPVTIWGRILMQRLWRAGIDWDLPLPEKYVIEYKAWYHQLQSSTAVKIPRWYLTNADYTECQLHLLADGGEQAYACVAYWRFTYPDSSVSVALVGSKARVAPLKPLSIPRLELQAALIATRLARTILAAHRIKPTKTVFWTDSSTVLKWIRSDARNFKPFVAHRLGEIAECTNPSDWRWLPTALNVADDATKPKRCEYSSLHRWFSGPSFLLDPQQLWPTESIADTGEVPPDPELRSELVGLTIDAPNFHFPLSDTARFSKWLRLLRSTARVIQAIRIFYTRLSRPTPPNLNFLMLTDVPGPTSPSQLHIADIMLAEKLLLRLSQTDSFPDEIRCLRTSQPLPRNSRLAALAPVLDEDGLLRLDTRIRSVPGVEEEVKTPVILDGRHHVTRLLIDYFHVKTAHGFNETVLNEIRQKYWVLRARSTVRTVANTCMHCRRFKGRLTSPQIGNLPVERLDHHKRPFTHTGLDYFGPVTVSVCRHSEKRYVALYTCLVTRAVHLEVVTSLSADAALMSLRRFIARRGSPSTIFTDNGTNFVGASRILRALYDSSIEEFAANVGIQWRFIPPASPFMGGVWERLVRCVKNAMQACLKDRPHPKEEVFATLLAEAEAIVNSRPLTYISSSHGAPEALTPFHFLLGTSSTSSWPADLTDADLLRRADWRRALRLADHFWERWLREYLPTLRARGPRSSMPNLKEGDVVLVADPTLPRGLWPLGRVTKVFTGPDGRVRVEDIFTKAGTLRRPVRKLLLMEAGTQPAATDV